MNVQNSGAVWNSYLRDRTPEDREYAILFDSILSRHHAATGTGHVPIFPAGDWVKVLGRLVMVPAEVLSRPRNSGAAISKIKAKSCGVPGLEEPLRRSRPMLIP
jgi:hypothetical protein